MKIKGTQHMNTQHTNPIRNWTCATCAALALAVGLAGGAHASTASATGTIESANPIAEGGVALKGIKGGHAWGKIKITRTGYHSSPTVHVGSRQEWIVVPGMTAPSIAGKLVSPRTWANAVKVGQWGYFYENTWLDLHLTPEYELGEVIRHDAQLKTITLQVALTTSGTHYPENGEKLVELVQVHPPRKQIIWLETSASEFDPDELKEKAGRGYANSRCSDAIIQSVGVDSLQVKCFRKGEWDEAEITLKRGWPVVLDGKIVSRWAGLVPGRRVMLGYYRGDTQADQPIVRTMDDEILGEVTSVSGNTITIAPSAWNHSTRDRTITVAADATIYLDGKVGQAADAAEPGQFIRVFPQRPQTIVVLKEQRPVLAQTGREQPATFLAIPPAENYQPGEGVPVESLPIGRSPSQWLITYALPFAMENDPMRSIGELASLRPQPGDKVTIDKHATAFAPIDPRHVRREGGIALNRGLQKHDKTTLLAYTVVEIPKKMPLKVNAPFTQNGRVQMVVAGVPVAHRQIVSWDPKRSRLMVHAATQPVAN